GRGDAANIFRQTDRDVRRLASRLGLELSQFGRDAIGNSRRRAQSVFIRQAVRSGLDFRQDRAGALSGARQIESFPPFAEEVEIRAGEETSATTSAITACVIYPSCQNQTYFGTVEVSKFMDLRSGSRTHETALMKLRTALLAICTGLTVWV